MQISPISPGPSGAPSGPSILHVGGEVGPAHAVGVGEELHADVGDHRRGRLGEAVPVEQLDALAEVLDRPQREVGRHRGAAHREALDRQLELVEPGTVEQLAHHGRHPAELGHLLLVGEPEGVLEVPLVHEDELGAAHGPGQDRRHPTDVEERTDRERGGLERGCRRPAAQQRLAGATEGHVPDVRHHPAVGEQGALGATGRARRVEHGDDVVAPDPDDGVGVDRGTCHQIVQGHVGRGASHADQRDAGRAAVVGEPLDALVVEDRHAGVGVGEGVGQLGPDPPGVHGGGDGAAQLGGPHRHGVLGQVAHADRDPVARHHPEGVLQLAGQAQGPVADVGEGVALVVVDHVDEVGVALAHGEHVEHGPRRPHEVPEGEAVDHDRLDLEGSARTDERLQARLVGVDGRDPGRVVDGHRASPAACTR